MRFMGPAKLEILRLANGRKKWIMFVWKDGGIEVLLKKRGDEA